MTRPISDLGRICQPGDGGCTEQRPQLIKYDGYRSLQEPVSEIVPCIGPRGALMNESDEDAIWAYSGVARGRKPAVSLRRAE